MHKIDKCPGCGLVLAVEAPPSREQSRALLGELAAFVNRYKAHNAAVSANLLRSNVGGRR
jgi:hypothetical protein